jgi:hypothetical protein
MRMGHYRGYALRAFWSFVLTFLWILPLIILLHPHSVSAQDTVRLFGVVRDPSINPFPNAELRVIDPADQSVLSSVHTDSQGLYSLMVPQGTYDIKAIPPPERGFQPAVALSQIIGLVVIPS